MLYYVTYKTVVPVEVEEPFDHLENLVDFLNDKEVNPNSLIVACIKDDECNLIWDEFHDFD